jgi:signal transduction histidine kinase
MLKQNRHIWSVFVLAVAVVTLSMSWLSWQALCLDGAREKDLAETELARREAELQERISSALYRLDLKMLPLISAEVARPHTMYEPLVALQSLTLSSQRSEVSDSNQALESPTQDVTQQPWQTSEFVNLHFQINADNTIVSPELPLLETFGDPQHFNQRESKFDFARQTFPYEKLQERFANAPLVSPTVDQQLNAEVPVYNNVVVENFQVVIQTEDYQQNQITENDNATNKAELQRSIGNRRINDEFSRRRDSTQQMASQNSFNNSNYTLPANGNYMYQLSPVNVVNSVAHQHSIPGFANSTNNLSADVRLGVMQPLWIDGELMLARQIERNGRSSIQVCWLNWDAIQVALRAEIKALLPDVRFQPLTSEAELKTGTALTTIPVQLVIDSQTALSSLAFDQNSSSATVVQSSGIHLALLIAWIGLGFAVLASAGLLVGVIRLSERRAAFVSSVTHELRTPLTTFRMYAEMLAEDMVPEEKQQTYANTLKTQADRLSYLVENVLQFARLERHPKSLCRELVTVQELFERFETRLHERATDAGFEWIFCSERTDDIRLATQVAAVEQILFNLVDNACKYARPAFRQQIEVLVSQCSSFLEIRVRDYGPGIAPGDRKHLFMPFRQSPTATAKQTGGVGLGLALCCRMAESIGGKLESEPCAHGALFLLRLPIRQ